MVGYVDNVCLLEIPLQGKMELRSYKEKVLAIDYFGIAREHSIWDEG